MNNFLEISLLGRVEIKHNGQPLASLATRKTEALLIYLVCTTRPQPRDVLAELLWPDRPQNLARHNLRGTLSRLRQTLGPYLSVTRQQIAFDQTQPYRLDVAQFEKQINMTSQVKSLTTAEAARLAESLSLYQADFLAGFYVNEAPDFEAWVTVERERLHHLAIEGIHRLLAAYLELGDYKEGIAWSQRLLRLDELDEVGHRHLMRFLALSEQRGAALSQFETYRDLLADVLGVEPTAETIALSEQIRAGQVVIQRAVRQPEPTPVAEPAPPSPPARHVTLNRLGPLPQHRLFGVTEAQTTLTSTLQAQDSPWLIAIDGIGGIGKTTLANTLAHTLLEMDRFYDIGWVSAKQEEFVFDLGIQTTGQPSLDEEALTDALLDQLEERPYPLTSLPEKRLALSQRLKAQPYLVVLDNLETVVDTQALLPYLRQLVNPSKFLLTTRHSLKSQADVHSLSLSELSLADALDFLRHQAEVRGLTALSQASAAQLERIYQVAGGNPLALKLVVGQLTFLPLAQVLGSLTTAEGKSVQELYSYIYWQAWHMLNEVSRQLLLSLPLSPNSTFSDLQEVGPLPASDLPPALRQLIDLSLVEVSGDLEEPSYRLHRLTETFLLHEVLRWQALDGDGRDG